MDYKIVIDPSRGGNDEGVKYNDIVEKDLILDIAKYIKERLISLGIKSYLTRENDKTLSDEERINYITNNFGKNLDTIVISLKLNDSSEEGGEIIYALRNSNGLSSRLATNLENNGFKINKYYQRRLPSDVSKDYYSIIRNTNNNQSLIIDLGSLSNYNNRNKLINESKLIGEAIVKTIANYVGINYTPINLDDSYIVEKGDSLYSIAKKFNTTVEDIKKLNNLKSNLLSIGQILKIQGSNSNNNTTYVVVKGDSLYSIARKFNTTVEEIKKLNNLSSNLLSIGQILEIPKSSSEQNTTYKTYKVVKGDNLYSIARKFNTTVEDIKKLNNLSSNLLSIGQVLKIN